MLSDHELRAFFCAERPVAMLRLDGPAPSAPRLVRPAGLDRLGYGPADIGSDGDLHWLVQEAADDLVYAVVVGSRLATPASLGEKCELRSSKGFRMHALSASKSLFSSQLRPAISSSRRPSLDASTQIERSLIY